VYEALSYLPREQFVLIQDGAEEGCCVRGNGRTDLIRGPLHGLEVVFKHVPELMHVTTSSTKACQPKHVTELKPVSSCLN
jgi:hypothetical protein